ncbi:hypothetical protein [Bacillus pumilus]|uniref:Anti-bacteriophage protein A/HamA C-terminal domain-containing protein n=1 Tax=Bacillus pumilus (strain SAFR-032) TaxID=315750 RepID=A8FJA2_BACP2|nr:hypothetical protein [Bacillus pumilus]ABV64319.1 hypothetical protein BPUM_3675 [Bacillus pumilus SAFR-032]MBU8621122.1 hypothetical protein [Bacillus pumilus]MBU8632282.1 hypothetical protein [Bacillus pumilus]MBU8736689.1 hypothetical protein [Bacillus pumilus]MBU8767205.1 hypothetical protein [Bacillus pumilus]
MQQTTTIFNPNIILGENYQIHVIAIEDYTQDFLEYMNAHFVSICEGESESDIIMVKQRAKSFFEKKSDSLKMGAIAEFIIHLYLKERGYKQECTFFNLEEGSIKKGFDGYYSKKEEEWIMESKSGKKDNNTHWGKVKTAYDDLKEKFSGNVANNPWKNAYNHASHIDVGTDKNLRKKIKLLSDNFTQSIYPSLKDFNLIPSSTIFLNDIWEEQDVSKLKGKLEKQISTFEYKEIIIICITKKSMSLFLDYLTS